MTSLVQQSVLALRVQSDPDLRRQAAEDLSNATGADVIAALARALNDESKGVRDAASRSLAAIGGKEVACAVVPYLKDENIACRNLAAELLYQLGKDSLIALEPYLREADQDVRKMAVDILGLLKVSDAVQTIIPLLDDADPNVVISAVEALGNTGSEVAVPHLIRLFENHVYTRAIVAEALGKIKGQRAAEFLSSSFEFSLADNSDPLTLFGIIEALGAIGDESAFSLLATHLPIVHGRLRKVMLSAMVWIADKAQMPLEIPGASLSDLIDLLEDNDLRVRLNAVKALACNPQSEVTRAFVDVLGMSEYFDVVLFGILEERDDALAVVLDKLGCASSRNTKQLISLVRGIARRSADDAATFGSSPLSDDMIARAFSLIEVRWPSADEETRQAIVETLFLLDGERTLVMLDVMMNDPDPWLRMRVIELIATQDDERLPEFISRYITDEDEMVRQTVEWILESKGFPLNTSNSM